MEEYLLHPNKSTLLVMPDEQLVRYCLQLLDDEGNSPNPDFDMLYGAGQILRLRGIAGVDRELVNWTERNARCSPDAIATLLAGYWATGKQISASLVNYLLAELSLSKWDLDMLDTTILALTSAHRNSRDPGITVRIEQGFRTIWSTAKDVELSPQALRNFQAVLHLS